ncbi:MAG: flagellar biosynthesis regulator FlaF [Thiobacillaceae bacterium]|nr:flagellar biosynthesis regulator FlaF [Thiobacillaceae bacterium]MDW8324174.1 flagellar biosynthesis regulator FlaF [Burkholderiales bacterium]
MNHPALEAYLSVEKATLSGRELEASVLTKAADMLDQARQGSGERMAERIENAVRHNLRVWTLFQAELLNPDHPMPTELRQNLINLTAFIDKRSLELIADPNPEKLDILIAINRNIAAGLRGDPGGVS